MIKRGGKQWGRAETNVTGSPWQKPEQEVDIDAHTGTNRKRVEKEQRDGRKEI